MLNCFHWQSECNTTVFHFFQQRDLCCFLPNLSNSQQKQPMGGRSVPCVTSPLSYLDLSLHGFSMRVPKVLQSASCLPFGIGYGGGNVPLHLLRCLAVRVNVLVILIEVQQTRFLREFTKRGYPNRARRMGNIWELTGTDRPLVLLGYFSAETGNCYRGYLDACEYRL